jgi:putative endonuclease
MARHSGPSRRCATVQKYYHVYIMASERNGTLYIGVTGALGERVWQHQQGLVEGFTKRYGVKMLVWYETFEDVHVAIQRETRLKKWKRRWKLELIEKTNPEWKDLALTTSL